MDIFSQSPELVSGSLVNTIAHTPRRRRHVPHQRASASPVPTALEVTQKFAPAGGTLYSHRLYLFSYLQPFQAISGRIVARCALSCLFDGFGLGWVNPESSVWVSPSRRKTMDRWDCRKSWAGSWRVARSLAPSVSDVDRKMSCTVLPRMKIAIELLTTPYHTISLCFLFSHSWSVVGSR